MSTGQIGMPVSGDESQRLEEEERIMNLQLPPSLPLPMSKQKPLIANSHTLAKRGDDLLAGIK